MPKIKPVLRLRKYTEVLRDVHEGTPVYLAEKGKGKYVVVDINQYEKTTVMLRLISEIESGRTSGELEGWTDLDSIKRDLGVSGA